MSFHIPCLIHARYEMKALIGRGGTSCVYLVYDRKLQTNWAMKVLNQDAGDVAQSAFQQELKLLSQLHAPWFPHVVDCFTHENQSCVIMSYIKGKTLLDYVGVNRKQLIVWLRELCLMLHHLHTMQPYPLIYLDVKPQNIIVDDGGHLHLLDFGSCVFLNGADNAMMVTPRLCCQRTETAG